MKKKIKDTYATFTACLPMLFFSGSAFAAQCSSARQIPLLKSRLVQFQKSNPAKSHEFLFERFAIRTLFIGSPLPPNNMLFRSPFRFNQTSRSGPGIGNVQPDAVGFIIDVVQGGQTKTYQKSFFVEAKALTSSPSGNKPNLLPSYEKYQIGGFIDALEGDTAAGRAGAVPSIWFVTTADVKNISTATVSQAFRADVAVFHLIVCEELLQNQTIQIGKSDLKNPLVYLFNGRFNATNVVGGLKGRI